MLRSIGLGASETRIYEFPSRKCRSIEVGNVVFPSGKLGNSASTPTSDSEIRVGKYEFPSPVERIIISFTAAYDRPAADNEHRQVLFCSS